MSASAASPWRWWPAAHEGATCCSEELGEVGDQPPGDTAGGRKEEAGGMTSGESGSKIEKADMEP